MQTQFSRNTCCAAAAAFAAVTTFAFTGGMLDHSLDRSYSRTLPVPTVEICVIPDATDIHDSDVQC